MEEFLPYLTGDFSVGLYSTSFDDIYHSAYGALNEAYEKFINPLKEFHFDNRIKVLDVCYGLGYNSKAFLNTFGQKHDIEFDCLDVDKNLFLLSPFIKTNKNLKDSLLSRINNNYGKKYLPENQKENILKYTKHSCEKKYKIDDWVNILIAKELYKLFGNELFENKFLLDKSYSSFFNKNMLRLSKFYQKKGYKYAFLRNKSTFLHNIYYRNISKRDIKFNFYVDDARKTIQTLENQYDVIMLDAFTTNKCPQLWSFDFIKQLYNHTNDKGLLITYSNSAVVRNTLLAAGYNVGKILNKNNKSIGTIAVKNNNIKLNHLTEYELGLVTTTKAGIYYKDENLNLSAEEILSNRKKDIETSNLISSSKYIKQYKGNKNEI